MPSSELENIDYSDAESLAARLLGADKATRTQILASFAKHNAGKLKLLFAARKLAGILKKQAPYSLLNEYELTMARLINPGKKKHFLAGYFAGRHYEDRIRPYKTEIKQLGKQGNLTAEVLMPTIADMSETEGYALAREYIDRSQGGIGSNAGLKAAVQPLGEIESAVDGIRGRVKGNPANKAELKKNWEIMRPYFDNLYDRGWGQLFITRAKKNDKLANYGHVLDAYLQFRQKEGETPKKPPEEQPRPATQRGAPPRKIDEQSAPAQPAGRNPTATSTAGGTKPKKKDILLAAIVDVFKQMPTEEVEDIWLGFIGEEPLIREQEKQELELMIEDARLIADLHASSGSKSEARKQQIEKYLARLTSDLSKAEEVSARLEIINRYRSFKTNSIIEKIATIYKILLQRVRKQSPARPGAGRSTQAQNGAAFSEPVQDVPQDQLEPLDVFADDGLGDLDQMAAFFQEEQKAVARDFEEISQTEDAEARFDKALQAYGSESFAEYLEPLRDMLNQPAGFAPFIRNLEDGPLKDIAPWQQKEFFDELFDALRRDSNIAAARPDIIRKLENYRDNKLAQPNLLETVFKKLTKIRHLHPSDPKKAVEAQIRYLSECLKNENFKSVRTSIYRIYRNVLSQMLDKKFMDEIAREPAWKQVLILKSLKQ